MSTKQESAHANELIECRPRTVRELGTMADRLGMKPSELLKDLERRFGERWFEAAEATNPMPSELLPPEGFRLDPMSFEECQEFMAKGPTFEGDGWEVTSYWTSEEGVTFYVDGDGDNAIPGAEAGKIAAALAEVSRLVSA